jgi:hypothetical protein
MAKVSFQVESIENEDLGQSELALVKTTLSPVVGEVPKKETWGTIAEFDRLFNACSERWQDGWDLDKVILAVKESEID